MNLIYVFADQLRYDCLHCHGDSASITPNLDAFAAQSADMKNAVSCHPVCAPYRATLFTGKHTPSTGMVINELRINPHHRCFAHVLNEAGYETCYIGKWHLYADQFGNHYDAKNSFIPKGPDRLGFDDYFAAYNFHHEYYAPKAYYHLDTPEKQPVTGYEPAFMTDMAIRELKRLAGVPSVTSSASGSTQETAEQSDQKKRSQKKPFALFLSLGTPHDPWTKKNVPEEFYRLYEHTDFPNPANYAPKDDEHTDFLWSHLSKKDREQLCEWRRVYHAMVTELDHNFGRLMEAVRSLGLEEDTLIVFTSDHGEMFGSHGRRAKNIYYEEAVRVPFLVHCGKHIAAGVRNSCFGSVDIMPSLLSLMGLPIPEGIDGKDRSGCIRGTEENKTGSLLMGTGAVALYFHGFEWRGIRDQRYTYALWKKDGKEYLYDHENDPGELTNLAKDPAFAGVKAGLKKEMLRQMAEARDNFLTVGEFRRRHIRRRRIQEL